MLESPLGAIATTLCGLIAGSFFNVCIHRIPRKISIVSPRSFCPKCNRELGAWENIPILSFVILKGRCRYCKERISPRYVVVEALAPLLFFFIWWRFRQPLEIVTFCLFTSILIVVTFVDLECQVIPNLCTYPGIGVGVALSFLPGGVEPLDCLSGAMCGGGLLYLFVILSPRLFGKEGMGGGDVKLAGVIGTFLGLKAVLLSIFIASLVGSIVGLALIVGRKISRSDYLPFAPFMSLGTLVMLFFGQEVTHLVRW